MDISVVVPVYNSQDSLRLLAERLEPVLAGLANKFELIFVNDGSRDNSLAVIETLAQEKKWIRGIDLMRNSGQHNALLCGVRAAKYEIAVTIDDDLQHPPEEIPVLISKLQEGFDVVYGTPKTELHGFFRNMASIILKAALRTAMGIEIARKVSAFRVFRTELREAFAVYTGTYVSLDVLLTWATTRFAAVPVRQDERTIGVSNYTIRKLVTHALNMITGFSVAPLQLASFLGFFFTLFGFGVLAYILIRFAIHGQVVPGFAFLGSTIAIFSGAQLFCVGIIGEYLARIYLRSMGKPAYTVRRRLMPDDPSS
jgi:glycosyltransferase involved in cell wall biosynthesis